MQVLGTQWSRCMPRRTVIKINMAHCAVVHEAIREHVVW
jgi:hypothetical protein